MTKPVADPVPIGQVARLTELPVATIRFYESKGLIERPVRRNGRRMYGANAVATLRLVRDLRRCGLGLGEISNVMALRSEPGATCDDLAAAVSGYAGRIAAQVRLLRLARDRLKQLAAACTEQCNSGLAGDCRPITQLSHPS